MRKEQRNPQDTFWIQCAKMAMGETARVLLDTARELATWEEFIQALKPKFLLHTEEYHLRVGTHSLQMNGDCHRLHFIIQTYNLVFSEYLHGTFLINMLKALYRYL